MPIAGRWPVLERIPRRRFRSIRRAGRIVSAAGALVILAGMALLVDLDFPWPHVLGIAVAAAWIVGVTWAAKQVWLRWLRRDFAGEVSAKMDAIRRAAPFN
jgi:hypothetical protein